MHKVQQDHHYFLIQDNTIDIELQQLFDPHYWQQQQRIIGNAKGRGTTWFIHSDDLPIGMNLALRHYYRGGLLGKINKEYYYTSNLNHNRGFNELQLLATLKQANLPVPTPFAAHIKKCGCFYTADILTEFLDHSQDLIKYLQHSQLTEQEWRQIGKLLKQLHELQVNHTDLNAHNILWRNQPEQSQFYLIDFDKCGFTNGDAWKSGNLARLHRSFIKEQKKTNLHFNDEHWQLILSGYYD